MKTVDLRRNPYRGILKEMEAELGKPTDQIHKALFRAKVPNVKMAELFNSKLAERQGIVERFRKNVRKAV